jgi:hypothetical protein
MARQLIGAVGGKPDLSNRDAQPGRVEISQVLRCLAAAGRGEDERLTHRPAGAP